MGVVPDQLSPIKPLGDPCSRRATPTVHRHSFTCSAARKGDLSAGAQPAGGQLLFLILYSQRPATLLGRTIGRFG
jgi:hypothetical protein